MKEPAPSRSLLWVGLEALSLSAVSFAVLAALAHTLAPAEFGRAALALSIVQIAASVVEALFNDAIAQRDGLTPRELGAAHACSALLGLALALVVALLALPAFGLGVAGLWSAAMAPSVALAALTAVPLAHLRRRLALREVAMVTALSRLASGALALALLAGGAGAWALVAQQNLAALLLLLLLAWRGHGLWRGWAAPVAARPLWRFAFWQSACSLLAGNRSRLFQLMCAPVVPAAVLGQLSLALRLVEMLAAMVVTGVARVALVRLSLLAHAQGATASAFVALTRQFSAIATPVFAGVAALALPLVLTVGDTHWQEAAPLVAWFALAQALRSPAHLAPSLFAAHGRPQLNLVVVMVELVALALLVALLHDPLAWAWRLLVVLPLSAICARQVVQVKPRALLDAVAPSFVAALAMGLAMRAAVHPLQQAGLPAPLQLALPAVLGALIYAVVLSLAWRGAWGEVRALARL
jgi:O-antigen/teichoic acid export membrane protein